MKESPGVKSGADEIKVEQNAGAVASPVDDAIEPETYKNRKLDDASSNLLGRGKS